MLKKMIMHGEGSLERLEVDHSMKTLTFVHRDLKYVLYGYDPIKHRVEVTIYDGQSGMQTKSEWEADISRVELVNPNGLLIMITNQWNERYAWRLSAWESEYFEEWTNPSKQG